MTRFQTLSIYAILILLVGVLVISLSFAPSQAIQYLVGFGMLLIGLFAAITTYKFKNFNVPYTYHLLHFVGFLIYGIALLFYGTSSERFLSITSFFLLYYGITEIIFSFELTMLKRKNINLKMVIYRLLIGLIIGIGSFIIIIITTSNHRGALLAAGVVFVFCGINLFLFKSIIKKLETQI